MLYYFFKESLKVTRRF